LAPPFANPGSPTVLQSRKMYCTGSDFSGDFVSVSEWDHNGVY